MQRLNFLFVELLIVGVTAAVAQSDRFHIDPSTDFSRYKTYKWLDTKGADHVMTPVDSQIVEVLDAELTRKGLRKADSASDLSICYHSAAGTGRFSKYQSEWQSYWFTIQANQVAIDMYDSSAKKLVWRNAGYVNPKAKLQDLKKDVAKLLENYPPKKK